MKRSKKSILSINVASIVAALSGTHALQVDAQTQAAEGLMSIEEVIVTGSRGAPRSVSDSPVPVDVFNSEDLSRVAFTDTNDVLRTLVPSYSLSRQPIADGAAFVRPAELRGLPTDKTLVLINSKRRHRAALVQIGGSGTQGPDIATIPVAALKSVEVLRDGAAAQYGSDAIAGVINFQLKNNAEGGSLSIDLGEYYEGDGSQYTISGNVGFALGSEGFFSISAELSDADASSRSEQYCESWFCLDPNNPDYDADADYNDYLNDPEFMAGVTAAGEVVQPWGQPNASAHRVFFNSGLSLGQTAELYAFGNYSSSEADGSFYYRYPGNGTVEDLRLEDGSVWNPLDVFPGGFTPRFFGDVTDLSFVGGINGEFSDSLSYDFSARLGSSKIEYTLKNTINPSLAQNSPTSFRPGDLTNEEQQLQADFVKEFSSSWDAPLIFAFGLSYLDESYEISEGGEASYIDGPHARSDPFGFCASGSPTAAGAEVIANGSSLDCADPDDPAFTVVGVGSNGFPGYSPEFSDTYERDSTAIYVDVSSDFTESFFLQAAARYEDYSDFDAEFVGKIALQYDLSEALGLRASVGTGFRAPTPGQQGTTNVSTRLPNGLPVATGLFPASGSVAQALGASDLKPETSTNYTFGFTGNFDNFSFTLDYYRIDLEDRINAISTLDVSTDPAQGAAFTNYQNLVNAGVVGAESIGGVFYFQNAFDSVTEGLDLVLSYELDSAIGSTVLTGSFNYNTSEFDSDPSDFLNAEDQYDFEHGRPELRGVFSVDHDFGVFSFLTRLNYFGAYENSDGSAVISGIQKFDPEIFVDVEGRYAINDNVSVSLGARNVFDEYPDKSNLDNCCGRVYWNDSVVDWQGGYYFLKLNTTF